MAKNNAEDEPSIEEILDSIRQIIADDQAEGEPEKPLQPVAASEPAPAPPPPPAPEPESDADEDILDLTQMVEDTPAPVPPPPTPEPEKSSDIIVVQSTDVMIQEQDEEPPFEIDLRDSKEEEEEMEELVPPPRPKKTEHHDSILTDHAESAALEAFSTLARKTAVEPHGVTLEEIVRSELKPLLRGWLDKHLSHVIERLVREELERVSKRVLED